MQTHAPEFSEWSQAKQDSGEACAGAAPAHHATFRKANPPLKYSDIKSSVLAIFRQTSAIVPFIKGPPGAGKTALALDIFRSLDIPEQNILMLRPSLREAVDFLGVPEVVDHVSQWSPPAEIHQLREGRWGVLIDELSDAATSVQNVMCGLIFDRQVGKVVFSPDVYLIATGNRTRDKSGANRVVSKLSNRTLNLQFEADVDDWTDWALGAGIDPMLIQFIRFRPGLLNAFDPDLESCPTPRQWEKVSRIPATLARDCYIELLAGLVGEGAAAEYLGFREIVSRIPDTGEVIANPQRAPIPRDPAILYAYVGALAAVCDTRCIEPVLQYVRRLPPEFGVMLVRDAVRRSPDIRRQRAYVQWAMDHAELMES